MDNQLKRSIDLMGKICSNMIIENQQSIQDEVKSNIRTSYGDLRALYYNIRTSDYVNYPEYQMNLNSLGYYYDYNNLIYFKDGKFEEIYNKEIDDNFYNLNSVIKNLNTLGINRDILYIIFGNDNVILKDKYSYIFYDGDCFIITPKQVKHLYKFQAEKIFSTTLDPNDKSNIYTTLTGHKVSYINKKEVIFREDDGVYSYFRKGGEVEFLSYNTPAENYGLIFNLPNLTDKQKMGLFTMISRIDSEVVILDDDYTQWIFTYEDDGKQQLYQLFPEMLNQSKNVSKKEIWYLSDRLPDGFLN